MILNTKFDFDNDEADRVEKKQMRVGCDGFWFFDRRIFVMAFVFRTNDRPTIQTRT